MTAIILSRKMIMKIKYTNENLKKQVKEKCGPGVWEDN